MVQQENLEDQIIKATGKEISQLGKFNERVKYNFQVDNISPEDQVKVQNMVYQNLADEGYTISKEKRSCMSEEYVRKNERLGVEVVPFNALNQLCVTIIKLNL